MSRARLSASLQIMYAVVETGGKQYRVRRGQTLDVERLSGPGREVSLRPVLLVDGGRVLARPAELIDVTVTATVLDESRGPKVHGFTYKPKTNQRRRWGHRQALSTIEITDISVNTAADDFEGVDEPVPSRTGAAAVETDD